MSGATSHRDGSEGAHLQQAGQDEGARGVCTGRPIFKNRGHR